MGKQLLFSTKSVDLLTARLNAMDGEVPYVQGECFARDFETLVSPTIDAPLNLRERVNIADNTATAIALFEAYPNLNALEASSVGFWTYLTHVDLWNYMRQRFSLAGVPGSELKRKIKERWFLVEPSQSSLMKHPLAGLWWGVRLSVAPERGAGRYDFTKILCRDIDLLTRTLGTYQLARLPSAMKGILGYIFDHPDDFKSEYEAKMRTILKHFNSIGGVVHLGCLDEGFYAEELDRCKDEWMAARKKKREED